MITIAKRVLVLKAKQVLTLNQVVLQVVEFVPVWYCGI